MSSKSDVSVIKEFVRGLSNEDVIFLSTRLTQNLQGDMADVLNFLTIDQEIDQLLKSKCTVDEFFGTLDQIQLVCDKEAGKRGLEISV